MAKVEYRTEGGRRERLCKQCEKWRPYDRIYWYINPRGYASTPRCRPCISPPGTKRGPKPGTVRKFRTDKQRNATGGNNVLDSMRLHNLKLDPFAAVKAAVRLGLDPEKIAAWFSLESKEYRVQNFGGPVRPEKAAA